MTPKTRKVIKLIIANLQTVLDFVINPFFLYLIIIQSSTVLGYYKPITDNNLSFIFKIKISFNFIKIFSF